MHYIEQWIWFFARRGVLRTAHRKATIIYLTKYC